MKSLLRVLGIILLGIGAISPTWAAEYSGSSGIKFQYPDTWIAVSALNLDQLDAKVQQYIRDKGINLASAETCLLNTTADDFAENINVVVTPGQNPINDSNLDKAISEIKKMYEQAGLPVRNLTGKVVQVADRSAFEMDQLSTIEGVNLHQKQLIVSGGGKTFFITLTTLEGNLDPYIPVLDQVKSTLSLPALQSGFDFGLLGNAAVRGGIIGGIVGAVVGLINYFKKKSAPGSAKMKTEDS